jgi:hypothetical protein
MVFGIGQEAFVFGIDGWYILPMHGVFHGT